MKTVWLIAFFILICYAVPSFSQKLEFTRIPPPTGLHPGTVSGVQDLNGYMWIGTYQSALRRYDGYRYKLYTNDPQTPNSMGGNWMESLYADSKGFIWIGTLGQGLDKLDPSTGNFIHYRFDPSKTNSLSNDTVRTIVEDSEGMLWIGTQNGLNHFNPQTGEFKRYIHQSDDPYSLSCNRVVKVYEDRQGIIWIGTGSVWDGQGGETDEGGLNRFDKETGRFFRYLHDPDDDHSLVDNKVKAIFEDSRGTFWVGTAGDGLHTMNRVNGTFQRHLHDPSNPKKLSRPPQKKIRPHAEDHITFIIEDATGYVWIGTFGNGLNRVDPTTREVTHYPNFKDPESGLEMEVPWWACVTRDGMLWIGYWRGLYRVDPLPKNIPYFSTGNPVTQILTDRTGALWYGTDERLVRKNPMTGKEQHFVDKEGVHGSLSNDRIGALFEDKSGSLWIGTGKGLNRFDRKSNAFQLEIFNSDGDSTLIKYGIGAIHQDRQGSFWFGIISEGAGVVRKDSRSGQLVHYPHDPGDTSSFSIGEVYRIFEDKAGKIWIGTRGGGLNRFIPETEKFQHFLSRANIHSLWQDSDGVLWVGTSTGLYKSNVELNSFSRFTGSNGELPDNMVVNGIVEDDDQRSLWVNASIGICRINPERTEVLIFSRYNDPIFYNGTGSYKGKNGEIFFGGGSGYFTLVPSQMKGNSKPPQIALSDFRIADKLVVAGGDESPLNVPLSSTTEIRLNHYQNVFSFDFAGIHYRSPRDNQHLFMMENLDNSWRKSGEEKTAYYYNVPPGEYVFKVKAANSDGMWSERSIAVIVQPPWWLTVSAYASYALLFGASLYGGWRYLQKLERKKNEQKVRQIKAEQILEMDRLKSRFFANISHEFRTPLTLILSPLERLLADQSENSRRKSLYEAMQRNAQRLLYLVNQLLDLSKLEARKMKLDAHPGDLIDFMRKVTASFASLAETKKINFQVQSPAGTLWTHFDEDKLEKVLNNLLSNAFKFTPPSGEIAISLRLKTTPNRSSVTDKAFVQTEFSVHDSGGGIPAEQLDRIFDRFYQVDNSLTREQEGTGIGLALTRELVELHQGTISVLSEMGKGTQFTVSLPLELVHPKQLDTTRIAVERQGVSNSVQAEQSKDSPTQLPGSYFEIEVDADSTTPLVLIVEDNDDLRRFLRQSLAEEANFQCRVIEASDGQQGYELAISQIPDLVISDVMMPRIDGMQLCHMLKNDKRTDHIPIILLTAKASGESKIEGLDTGADDYLTKPFEESELLARVKNLVESRRKLRERFSREITLQPASISMTSMDEKLLQHVLKIMEEHMSDSNFGVEAFGREAGMSRTQLHRKLKALTDQSPGDFIRMMRLKRAAELLNNHVGSIAEVAFMVGFNDPSYFTKCFQKQFGRTPSEFIIQN